MTRTRLGRWFGLLAAVLALALAGAARAAQEATPGGPPLVGKAGGPIVIGYSAPSLVGGQIYIQNSLVRYAEAKGWQVITANANGDAQKQIDDVNNFISLDVDAIVAVPENSAGFCAAVGAAREANIPIYTIDRSPEGCQVNMTVLSDNYLAGRQSGEAVVRLLTEKYGEARGTVLEVTGNLAQNVAQLRGAGFNDVVAQHPGIEVITRTGDWDAAKGQDIVRDVVSAEPDLDAIYLHSDNVYVPGTQAVLQELGRLHNRGEEGHIIVAGVDGGPSAVQAIRDGWMDQASNQPVPDFGLIADFIEQELRGTPISPGEVVREGELWSPARIEESDVGPQLFLATTSVTAANVDDPRLFGNQPEAEPAGEVIGATPEAGS